jgi:hypothetical protein
MEGTEDLFDPSQRTDEHRGGWSPRARWRCLADPLCARGAASRAPRHSGSTHHHHQKFRPPAGCSIRWIGCRRTGKQQPPGSVEPWLRCAASSRSHRGRPVHPIPTPDRRGAGPGDKRIFPRGSDQHDPLTSPGLAKPDSKLAATSYTYSLDRTSRGATHRRSDRVEGVRSLARPPSPPPPKHPCVDHLRSGQGSRASSVQEPGAWGAAGTKGRTRVFERVRVRARSPWRRYWSSSPRIKRRRRRRIRSPDRQTGRPARHP